MNGRYVKLNQLYAIPYEGQDKGLEPHYHSIFLYFLLKSVKSSGKTLKNKKSFGGKKKKKPKNIYILEDSTSGNTEELIPKAEVNPIQKEVPLIHSEDESDWERKDDFGMDWGKELKNLKISDKLKCESDSEWDNEDAFV